MSCAHVTLSPESSLPSRIDPPKIVRKTMLETVVETSLTTATPQQRIDPPKIVRKTIVKTIVYAKKTYKKWRVDALFRRFRNTVFSFYEVKLHFQFSKLAKQRIDPPFFVSGFAHRPPIFCKFFSRIDPPKIVRHII